MFSSLRIALILVIISAAGGGFLYVKALQKDLDTAKANIIKLEDAVSESNRPLLTTASRNDFEAILFKVRNDLRRRK